MSESEPYAVYAVRYGHNPAATASENFLRGDPHDGPMPLDFFIWAIKGRERTIILDTGFDQAMGEKRQRQFLRSPGEGLKAIGLDPNQIEDVILSHMHYDHCGNYGLFPRARFHPRCGDGLLHRTLHVPRRHAHALRGGGRDRDGAQALRRARHVP